MRYFNSPSIYVKQVNDSMKQFPELSSRREIRAAIYLCVRRGGKSVLIFSFKTRQMVNVYSVFVGIFTLKLFGLHN